MKQLQCGTPGERNGTQSRPRSPIEQAFDALPNALIVVDETFTISGCNRMARLSLGLDETAAMGGMLGALLEGSRSLDAADQLSLAETVEAMLTDGAGEARLNCARGRTFQLSAQRLDRGAIISFVAASAAPRPSSERGDLDGLTGLLNRSAFRECVSDAEIEVRTRGVSVALLYLDLDRFKQVNDTLGHSVGDALLARVADRMRKTLRNDDVIGRLGGDEFGVLTRSTSLEAINALGARLIDLVSRPYLIDGHQVTVGVSVGVAFMPTDADTSSLLAKCADLALYRAKDDGRGVLRRFHPTMSVLAAARRALEIDLRKAAVLGEFELHYQPQMSADGSGLVGFESLLRWNHPTRGRVSPLDFIPLAEETGQIVGIGEWVLQSAVTEAMTWPEHLCVAVNVSPVQFRSGKLVSVIASVLERSGLAPGRLEIEITEGVLLNDERANIAILTEIHGLGVRVAIDDFGTGYASLAYLKRFAFDKIKIDQSFVREMMRDANSDAIVNSIVTLGRVLGMTTIAEGVETAEELARIRAHGCVAVQGYLTGKPMSRHDLHEMLAALPAARQANA